MRRSKMNEPIPKPEAISLCGNLSMQVRYQRNIPTLLIRLALAVLGMVSSVYVVQGFYQFPINLRQVVLFTAAATILFGIIYGRLRKFHKLIIGILLIYEIAVYLFWHKCLVGYRFVIHTIASQIRRLPRSYDGRATLTETVNVEFYSSLFFCAVLLLIAMCLTYFVVKKPSFIVTFLLTFPFLESGLFFGYVTSSFAVFGLVAFWLSVLVLQLSGSKIAHRHICRKRSNRGLFFSKAGKQFAASEVTALFVLLVTMLGSLLVVAATQKYERSERIDRQRSTLEATFGNLTVKDITGVLKKIPIPYEVNLLVDDVDLTKYGNVHFEGGTVLNLKFLEYADFSELYLKGLSRGAYTGRGWTQMSDAYRDNKKLLKELARKKRYPQTLDFFTNDSAQKCGVISVRALQHEQVNYLPNEMLSNDKDFHNVLFDTELRMDSQTNYKFEYAPYLRQQWSELAIGLKDVRSSDELLRQYEDFAVETYSAPEENQELEDALYAPFRAYYEASGTHSTYDSVLETVRNYIWEHADYTLHPGTCPPDSDFVTYFLNENHAGYCAHYASAGVLLCRSLGLPARYCQGYLITRDDYILQRTIVPTSSGIVTVKVPDYRAHAWAEIFVPTIGWMPYEFTEEVAAWSSGQIPHTEPAITTTKPDVTTSSGSQQTTTATFSTVTVTVPNQPVVTTKDEPQKPFLSTAQITVLLSLTVVLLLLALAVMLWRQHHSKVVSRRTHRMCTGSPNQASQHSYAFLKQLLAYEGIVQGNLSHERFAEIAEEQCKLLPQGAMPEALAIQQKVAFSGTEITQEEAARICEIAQTLAKDIYHSADKKRKFRLRWLEHIVQ